MKLKLMTMVMAVFLSISAQAQSLTAKNWFADMSDKENDITLMLTYDDKGGCDAFLRLEDVEEDEEGIKMTIQYNMLFTGTYTLTGKVVKMAFDTANAETKLTFDIEGVDESTKNLMMSLFKPELDKMKPEIEAILIQSLPTNDSYEITKLTETELQFDGGFDLVGMDK